MSSFDWCIVILINGAIIAFGLWKAYGTKRAVDWFLAGKGLPWWIVGLSMFATAVDSGDYVAVAGAAYRNGMSYISPWWLGLTIGWITVAYVVLLPMYRTGMFTNAEYLEYRFGPVTRIISVLIQIQYRTNVLANVAYSLYLTFSILTDWGTQTWWLVVAVACGAAAYTASGGLKSVAITDAAQSVVMVVASLVLWFTVFTAIGGWNGFEQRLAKAEVDQKVANAMLHVGGHLETGVPPSLVLVGWIVFLTAYCVVNHSQAMRMLSCRSEWDIKMAAVMAASLTAGVMWFNVTLGILGRAVFPDLGSGDQIFPLLVREFLLPMQMGLTGIVVAGLLAGGISTYDSIGSAVSAVFTRDLYARFFVKYADDRHYLRVSRLATFAVIGVSFVYVPFLEDGMVRLYVKLVGVTAVPLLTVYMMGILTPVHRLSGSVGLIVGVTSGISRLLNSPLGLGLPLQWTNEWWGCLWSILLTAVAMLVTTLLFGWADPKEIAGLVYRSHRNVKSKPTALSLRRIEATKDTWIERSLEDMPQMPAYPFSVPASGLPWYKRPLIWTGLLIGIVSFLNLVAFW
ncbi:MAG: hypothetical protein QF918_11050 [Pirellulaceae bacterium]|nr:hypothetical protein [Pirellulaceae bacterium]MDP6557161.1 hypothetical protein [Pirellulaceae bacterium]MDP6717626.1 hypothetical protein [Pirellulaceae bacterium]